jgi:thioredoxin-like negative regulator of GroEL
MAAKLRIEKDPKNLEGYNEYASILMNKNRHEEAIGVLLDMLTIDRNWHRQGDKKPQEKLIESFAKLGQTNETVKKAKKRLAKILF